MKTYKKTILIVLLFFYISINLFYLSRFPFIHSDESWLSGLSRNIMETSNYSSTEPFFDLMPRHPHAIKILFHTLQILFIKIMGYNIFTVRLISLIFGLITLIWFYKLSKLLFHSKNNALASTMLLAFDIQFIYATHFARQEIIILFFLIFALHFILSHIENIQTCHHIILGTIIGLAIGFHPNSFIISLPLGLIYLFHIFVTKKLKLSGLIIFISTTACFATVFVILSLFMDPNFVQNYANLGHNFGVFNSIPNKITEITDFYNKLYNSVSGTYYTPNIKFQFILFSLVMLGTIYNLFRSKNNPENEKIATIVLAIFAINMGIIIIGRYNQTSIVFIFPFFYLLTIYVLNNLKKSLKWFAITLLCFILATSTLLNALPYINNNYNTYLKEISKTVGKNNIVLANLNADYYFDNGALHDFRNLAFLQEENLNFEQYIEEKKIEYIIYPEEMDLIYQQRPRWNSLYGNLYPYYDDMQKFFQTKCKLVYRFENPTYGIRIARYVNTKNWEIRIYKVIR